MTRDIPPLSLETRPGSDIDDLSWLVWFARKQRGRAVQVAEWAWDQNAALRIFEREREAARLGRASPSLDLDAIRQEVIEGIIEGDASDDHDLGPDSIGDMVYEIVRVHAVREPNEVLPPTQGEIQRRCWTLYVHSDGNGQCVLFNGHSGKHDFALRSRTLALRESTDSPSLDALRALSDAATPGPWIADERIGTVAIYTGPAQNCLAAPHERFVHSKQGEWVNGGWALDPRDTADAAFIVAAANYVRARLAIEEPKP